MSGGGRGGVPTVQETVVLEAYSTEESVIRVECLGTCQGRNVRAAGGGRGEEREGIEG